MARSKAFEGSKLKERIKQASCLKDLVRRVPYATMRDKFAKQDVTKAKDLYDLVRDNKKIAEAVFKLEERVQFLLCREWWSLTNLANELGVTRKPVEMAVGRLGSSGYTVKRRNVRTPRGVVVEYHIISENSHD